MAIKLLSDRERFDSHIKFVVWRKFGRKWDCWKWQLFTDKDGYGLFKICSYTDGSRKMVRAHRWAYEHFRKKNSC